MSCQSCVAATVETIAQYKRLKAEAQKLANESGQPVYLLKDSEGYAISTNMEPNAVEAILPD